MNQPSAENFGVVLIENNALGVCIFDSERLTINCGQILYFTSYDKSLLAEVFFDCQQIITNQSKHVVLSELKERLTQFKGQLKVQSINFIIKELPTLKKIHNKDAYIQMMYEESPIKFKALGMTLNHLINETAIYKRQEIRFDDIQFWKDYVFQHVQITYSQMKYLQIATESLHPSLVKTRADNSLGNSVLKIYDSFLRINGSKRFLKRLMYNPTFCKKQIQKRQATIQWIVKFMNDQKFYKRIFNSIFAIESIIVRFQSNKIQEEDWRKLAKSIQSIIELRNSLPLENVPYIVKNFIDKPYWPNLSKVIKIINKTIDVAPFGIKYGYDKQLERLKDMLGRLPAIMTKIQNENEWGQFADLVFLPQIGYLVSVPHQVQNYPPEQLLVNWENHAQEQLQDEDSNQWQLKFTNYTGRFYSNPVTRQLNEKFGDIKGTIRDIERRILDELQQEILAISQELKDVYWTVVQIQTFYGIAQLSRCMARPRMSSEQLIIQDGWNMLLGQNAVQNHAFMFEHEKGPKNKVFNSELNIINTNYTNRLSLLSGPNGSGKTIFMKQIGLIIYLAHCGFYVPATLAQIPLVDRISVVQSSSSLYNQNMGFGKELYSMAKIMNGGFCQFIAGIITNKSLVLIDEVGLGQDYSIAMKMLYACVSYLSGNTFPRNRLLSKSTDLFKTPLVFIVTHLTQLMSNQIIHEDYYVRYFQMDVSSNLDPLFKLKPGLVKSGYGIQGAQNFMENEQIIEKAQYWWKRIR